MNLDEALRDFDAVEANLKRLEEVWQRYCKLIPEGVAYFSGGDEEREARRLQRTFINLLDGIPPIDGWKITATLMGLNEIAHNRFEARDIGEFSAQVQVEEAIFAPGEEIDEYRDRLDLARRRLVRARLDEVVADVEREVDELLLSFGVTSREEHGTMKLGGPALDRLRTRVRELHLLLGTAPRPPAWVDFTRHLRFGLGTDLLDIKERDWPAIKHAIARLRYDSSEPIPVRAKDLGQVVATTPTGVAKVGLAWSALEDADFEKLIFTLISDVAGYENANWLTHTTAADLGRDLEVWRVFDDPLSGKIRQRVIIQCKHWQSRSVSDDDIAHAVHKMRHWDRPHVDVLIITTSGRFTINAVQWAERHNADVHRPKVELWPEAHLETLLNTRAHLVATFGLR